MPHFTTHCRDCPERRAHKVYGAAYITAVTKATAHGLRAGHTVDVYEIELVSLTSQLIETVGAKRSSNQSPLPLDVPPF